VNLSSCGAQLICEFEGYSSTAYWDSYGGVWTIGFGTTDPRHAYSGATTNRAEAMGWLREEADGKDSPGINKLGLSLTQAQHDALVSFSFNLGPGVIANPSSSIGAALRNHGDVPGALMQYTHAGGQELPGLVTRRRREGHLFATGDYGFACTEEDMPLTEAEWGRLTETVRTVVKDVMDKQGVSGAADPRNDVVKALVAHGDSVWKK
jgi:GH24 family phage-related lysozyme (muramidase)